ncbi:MAG TPA: ABC transporter permease [Solirubrobacteraceae bacterium]|nr:ABC transporter permease [Solirubrobacteraceae bacterium]
MSSSVALRRTAAVERGRQLLRRKWVGYLARRLAYGLLVIVLVALTVFLVTRILSDPARQMLPLDATPEQYVNLKRSLGLDKPLTEQFAAYVGDLVTFDLGESFWQKTSVSGLIWDRLPNTVLLAAVAIGFAVLIGVPLGVGAALRPGSKLDQSLATFALLGLSLPQFWLGAMLILVFAVTLGWFPTSGMGGISHIVLPALTLGLPSLGRIAQITRTAMIDELASQHILTARAKGLSARYVVTRHALRNVLVPITTIVSWEAAYTLAGYSVIVETVFAWPGLGYLAIQAIQREDLILIQGIVIVVATIVVILNIVTDVLYTVIDPRIELK